MQWLKHNNPINFNKSSLKIPLLNINDLQKAVKEFQSLDYKSSSIENIDQLFRKIIAGFFVFPLEWYDGSIFRARKHSKENHLFENTKDLIYPIKPNKYGRLNDIGESIFYGAVNKDTAMVEMRLKVGDVITVLESKRFNTSNPLLLMEVGVKELIIKENKKPDFIKLQNDRFIKNLKTDEEKMRYSIINTFLVDEITRIISDSKSYKYKGTIPIGQYYIKGNPHTEGMFYPSISRKGSACIALKPNSYHKFFKPEVCHKLRVTNIKANGEIDLFCENGSTSIEQDGKINWQL